MALVVSECRLPSKTVVHARSGTSATVWSQTDSSKFDSSAAAAPSSPSSLSAATVLLTKRQSVDDQEALSKLVIITRILSTPWRFQHRLAEIQGSCSNEEVSGS